MKGNVYGMTRGVVTEFDSNLIQRYFQTNQARDTVKNVSSLCLFEAWQRQSFARDRSSTRHHRNLEQFASATKKQAQLSSGIVAIRAAVNDVLVDGGGVIAPEGSRGGVFGVGCAHHFAQFQNDVWTL